MTRLNSSSHFICNMVYWQILKSHSFSPFEQSPGPTPTSSGRSPHSFLHLDLRSHHRSPFIFVAPKDHKTSHWLRTYSCDDVPTDLPHEQTCMTWTIFSNFVILFIDWVPHSSSSFIITSESIALSALTTLRNTHHHSTSTNRFNLHRTSISTRSLNLFVHHYP